MVFRRFTIEMFIRFAFILANLAAIAYFVTNSQFYATMFLLFLASVAQIISLLNYVNRTNTELTRFLNAIRYSDFSQSFSIEHLGSNFADLNLAFDDIMKSFREARSKKEEQAHYLKTLVEHVPVPLLEINGSGKVSLLNNSAIRMFGRANIASLDGLDEFGAIFQRDMMQALVGETKLTEVTVGEVTQQVMMSTTQLKVRGDTQKIIALQDIQSHLDATELAAWQNLVRVISHEIMNSITPIASLARTASHLVDDMEQDNVDNPIWQDVKQSVDTVARRSEGLMHFVQSYKQLTQIPPPKMKKINISLFFARLEKLMLAEWHEEPSLRKKNINLRCEIITQSISLAGDEELLDQVLVNLLHNAKDACLENDDIEIILRARVNDRQRVVIEVIDNGAGIEPDKMDKIFMPFFTTKQTGSGVGLALSRKIMMVHGGSISVHPVKDGGTILRLMF